MPIWTISAEPVTGAGVDEVMREYFTEMGRRVLGRAANESELLAVMAHDPHTDLGPPCGEFLVARDGEGAFLGCVGVRLLPGSSGTAELKRMYVRPDGRGSGLGRGLLHAVEETARKLGATLLVCETNTQLVEARSLYLRSGFEETAPYEGHGRADHWFAKVLA
ncbi:GNAT family N-acetyltransferase [Streptomyces sp. TRM66268-LWL]|uniref:GNAT family N-acetyltransferase n=1 Tax=Streptomyces polyasparticus TaxID=2767826 RepID=A0ABR7S6Y1_9ACTN|nr:GNAT family N-acetyltransferase [Streptomyces polyasparticus]MBC9711247.1 GNAT family N-acetyltransferase [Streptomyces polyasparticus]